MVQRIATTNSKIIGIKFSLLSIDNMHNFFLPKLMFLSIIVKVEADQFSFLGVDVLDLVGDKSDSD